jgi:XrtJ-associated TM-motif-TM protein
MKKLFSLTSLAVVLALLLVVPRARAVGGCDDSPENPTVILAGLAGGAFAVSQIRQRVRARRACRNQDLR